MAGSQPDLVQRIARFDNRVTVWIWRRPVTAGFLVAAFMAVPVTPFLFLGAYGWFAWFSGLALAMGLGGMQWHARRTLPKWLHALEDGRVDDVPVLWRGAVRMYAEGVAHTH